MERDGSGGTNFGAIAATATIAATSTSGATSIAATSGATNFGKNCTKQTNLKAVVCHKSLVIMLVEHGCEIFTHKS